MRSYPNGANETLKNIGFQDKSYYSIVHERVHVSVSSFCKLLLAGWVRIQNSDSHSFNKLSECKHKNLNMTYSKFCIYTPSENLQ